MMNKPTTTELIAWLRKEAASWEGTICDDYQSTYYTAAADKLAADKLESMETLTMNAVIPPKEPTTLEYLQDFKPEHFDDLGEKYISDLIQRAAKELEKLEKLIKFKDELAIEANDDYDEKTLQAENAERILDRIGGLHAFPVPMAPNGERAVWLSDIQTTIKSTDND
jgi:hypothetical protein